jgi:hypothetical protein
MSAEIFGADFLIVVVAALLALVIPVWALVGAAGPFCRKLLRDRVE